MQLICKSLVGILLTVLLTSAKLRTSATLVTVPPLSGDVLTVCPGEEVSITCTHSNTAGEQTRWAVSDPVSCGVSVSHTNADNPSNCGPFQFTMVSDNNGQLVNSSAQATASPTLDGAVLTCQAGGLTSSPQVGNFTFQIPDIPSSPLRLSTTSDQLQWSLAPGDSGYMNCIKLYSVEWNGNVLNTTSTSVSLETLNTELGLPFCRLETVTVTALDISPVSWDNSTSTEILLQIQGFFVPMVEFEQLSPDDTSSFQITVQNISEDIVPSRTYGYSSEPQECIPDMPFNGSMFVIDLPLDVENTYTLCVRFKNDDCEATSHTAIQVSIGPTTIGGPATPSDNTGLIVGVVVGAILLIVVAAILISAALFMVVWKGKHSKRKVHDTNDIVDSDSSHSLPLTETQPDNPQYSDYADPRDAIKTARPNFGNVQQKQTQNNQRKSNVITESDGVYAEVHNPNVNGNRVKTVGSKTENKKPGGTLV